MIEISDGPDPTGFSGPLNPAAEVDYLSAAANWLELAEQGFTVWNDVRSGNQDRTEARMSFTVTARLAELNMGMARACADYQRNQPVTLDVTLAPTPADVKAMSDAVGQQLATDTAAHEAVRLRPGTDPEPVAQGELWIAERGWFWYRVNGTVPDQGLPAWLPFRHYAQFLRWESPGSVGVRPWTWEQVAGHPEGGDLRRPTADERAAFYGPEPDPTPEELRLREANAAARPGESNRPDAPTPDYATCSAFVADPGRTVGPGTLCERCSATAWAHTSIAQTAPPAPPPPRGPWQPQVRPGTPGASQWNG